MKPPILITLGAILLCGLCATATPMPIAYEFDWTAQNGYSQYDATFLYSSGTTSGGVFTPMGLNTYSIGTPFGISTPTSGPVLSFFTDTKYGPSFQVQGTVEPINYANNPIDPGSEVFEGNNLALYFQAETDFISFFQNGADHDLNLTGTWTETIITAPDGGSSLLLLALGFGGITTFHFSHRSKLA